MPDHTAPAARILSPLFTWRSAIADSELPAPARHVALSLSLHMSERGDSCFPSIATIARETGWSTAAVKKHLSVLVGEGWLTRRPGGGRYSTRYSATIPEDLATRKPGHQVASTRPPGSHESVIESVTNLPPSAAHASLAPATAQVLTGWFVDTARARGSDPPRRVVGMVARSVKELLDEGIDPARVQAGIQAMLDKGLASAHLLAQFVMEAELPRQPARKFGYGMTSAEISQHGDEIDEAARRLREEGLFGEGH